MIIRLPHLRLLGASLLLAALAALSATAALPVGLERVSLTPAELQANDDSVGPPDLSADGRFVLFVSRASNLYGLDTNNAHDVFVRDRGVGFDQDAVPDDRHGVRGSIVGRMERYGGKAVVRSRPGAGTEVELTMSRSASRESRP